MSIVNSRNPYIEETAPVNEAEDKENATDNQEAEHDALTGQVPNHISEDFETNES
jgi:hypothetical protein